MRLKAFAVSTALATALLGACAAASPPPGTWDVRAAPQVEVTRDGDRWTADYVFNRDAQVWAFMDSALMTDVRQPWRPTQWTVETPGVVMERRGHYDVIRALDGGPVPRQVRFSLKPKSVYLEAEYGTLTFSDGAVALPTRQFDVFALASVEAAEAMPADLNGVDLEGGASTVVWRDTAGPVLFNGRRQANLTTTGERSYVLLGQARVTPGEGLTTVIDPNLPPWIGEEIRSFAPHVGDYYLRRLGAPGVGSETSTVMVSWNGPTERLSSMGGSVLPGLIVMKFEGVGVLNPDKEVLERSRWFIGHESAHFWLGQAVRYQFARDAWITEGGADLMAVRALKALDPAYDDRAELQTEVDDCIELSRKPVAEAGDRGEHRAYYACGAVFAMAAEGAQKRRDGGDWFDFLRPVLAANREDGVLSRAEWLDALTRVSGDPSLSATIERMLDQGEADPAAEIASLFQKTGVRHRVENGKVVLI
ncbi:MULTISPECIES: hypothetical protein [unclassified Brevundimonas]|uniref:hypothetical protein n=1 Tax=unclassified Brevundimonas TaxID=2622653 RepID=UPI0025B8DF3F|nr:MULTISPECIES: hypothetical protein [unclassified Brevundimonas]